MVKNSPASAGEIRDVGSIPGSGRSPGEGHGNTLQYSCLENPHGQRSLAGCSPWSCRESVTTELTEDTRTPVVEPEILPFDLQCSQLRTVLCGKASVPGSGTQQHLVGDDYRRLSACPAAPSLGLSLCICKTCQ